MKKPTPKTEIVMSCKSINHGGGGLLFIHVASPDAYNWIAITGAEFGMLYEPDEVTPYFRLFVSPFYDVNDVEQYLLSYMEEGK